MSGYTQLGQAQPSFLSRVWGYVIVIPTYIWKFIVSILDYLKNFICAGTFWSYLALLALLVSTGTFIGLYFRTKELTPKCPSCPNSAAANNMLQSSGTFKISPA
jgi:hypothetical protein